MTESVKDRIAETVRNGVEFYWPGQGTQYGTALHHALVGKLELMRHGIESQIQAGSMSWPIINLEDDDGEMNTHFSMMWDPDGMNSVMSMASGGIPEMHFWLAIGDDTIVDFATHQFKMLCANTTPEEWTGEDPPDFLWAQGTLPKGVQYTPNEDAIKFAHFLLPGLWETRSRNKKEE